MQKKDYFQFLLFHLPHSPKDLEISKALTAALGLVEGDSLSAEYLYNQPRLLTESLLIEVSDRAQAQKLA